MVCPSALDCGWSRDRFAISCWRGVGRTGPDRNQHHNRFAVPRLRHMVRADADRNQWGAGRLSVPRRCRIVRSGPDRDPGPGNCSDLRRYRHMVDPVPGHCPGQCLGSSGPRRFGLVRTRTRGIVRLDRVARPGIRIVGRPDSDCDTGDRDGKPRGCHLDMVCPRTNDRPGRGIRFGGCRYRHVVGSDSDRIVRGWDQECGGKDRLLFADSDSGR